MSGAEERGGEHKVQKRLERDAAGPTTFKATPRPDAVGPSGPVFFCRLWLRKGNDGPLWPELSSASLLGLLSVDDAELCPSHVF